MRDGNEWTRLLENFLSSTRAPETGTWVEPRAEEKPGDPGSRLPPGHRIQTLGRSLCHCQDTCTDQSALIRYPNPS